MVQAVKHCEQSLSLCIMRNSTPVLTTKGMGTKRKRSDSNQEEDARKEERSQEVIGIAEECAACRDSNIKEQSDDEVDEGRDPPKLRAMMMMMMMMLLMMRMCGFKCNSCKIHNYIHLAISSLGNSSTS